MNKSKEISHSVMQFSLFVVVSLILFQIEYFLVLELDVCCVKQQISTAPLSIVHILMMMAPVAFSECNSFKLSSCMKWFGRSDL
jgi:hypothetical protein